MWNNLRLQQPLANNYKERRSYLTMIEYVTVGTKLLSNWRQVPRRVRRLQVTVPKKVFENSKKKKKNTYIGLREMISRLSSIYTI